MRAKRVSNLEIVWLKDYGPGYPVSKVANKDGEHPGKTDWMASGTHVIHDDPEESLAIRWGQANTQAVYFIDQKGIVRTIETHLSDLIDELETGKFDD